jgi:hypothetical protein
MERTQRTDTAHSPPQAEGGQQGDVQDFGSNAVMAQVLNAMEDPQGDGILDAMEWEAEIKAGANRNVSVGDKVTGAGGAGAVEQVHALRSTFQWYAPTPPPTSATVNLGSKWSRSKSEASKKKKTDEDNEEANRADQESEYDSRRSPEPTPEPPAEKPTEDQESEYRDRR